MAHPVGIVDRKVDGEINLLHYNRGKFSERFLLFRFMRVGK